MKKFADKRLYPFYFLQAVFFILTLAMFQIIVTVGIYRYLNIEMNTKMVLMYAIPYLITIPLFNFIRSKNTPGHKFQFKTSDYILILSIIIIAPLFNIGIMLPISNSIPINEYTERFYIFDDIDFNTPYMLISVIIIAPIAEEFLFRGLILDGLLRRYNPYTAIIISAILFGLVHLNPWQMAYATAMGLIIGFIYFKTKNLSLAILWHLLNNSTGTVFEFFGSNYDLIYENSWLYFVLIPIALCLTCLLIWHIHKSYNTNNLNWKNG